MLTESSDYALQVTATESFTTQIAFKTTATSGVIIGTRPTVANWTLQLVNGKVQFSLFDGKNTSVIISNMAVNDGNWHQIVAVRDATSHLLHLYVDGIEVATPVADTTTGSLEANDNPNGVDPVVLGAYNTQQNELAFTVDSLRFTTAALRPPHLGRYRPPTSSPRRLPRQRISISQRRPHDAARSAILAAAVRPDAILRRPGRLFRSPRAAPL